MVMENDNIIILQHQKIYTLELNVNISFWVSINNINRQYPRRGRDFSYYFHFVLGLWTAHLAFPGCDENRCL